MYFSLCLFVVLVLPAKCLYPGDSCLADDKPGTCILLQKCTTLQDEIANAGRPLPKHIHTKLVERSCGFSSNDPVVCCTSADSPSTPELSDTSTPNNTNSDTTINPLAKVDQENPQTKIDPNTESRLGGDVPDIKNHRNLRLLPIRTCGVDNSFRILDGNRTELLEMPWMVLLSYDTPRGKRFSCGGTLISDRYVLTAAHCLTHMGRNLMFAGVVLGEWDTRKDPDCEGVGDEHNCVQSAKHVTVETVIPHTGYSPQTLVDDIALLRLSEPADFNSDRIMPVCLPVTPELQNEDLAGLGGIVSGWGATEDGMQSPVLLKVELPIVANNECQDAYKGSPRIYNSQICAGGILDRDSCAGDSGGPLMYYGNVGGKGLRYVQRGIVSYGSRQCGIGLPGVYTRIAYYMDWILDNIHE